MDGRNLDLRPQNYLKSAFLGVRDGLEFARTEASFVFHPRDGGLKSLRNPEYVILVEKYGQSSRSFSRFEGR